MKNSAFSNFKVFAGNSHLELAEEIASIMGKPLGDSERYGLLYCSVNM